MIFYLFFLVHHEECKAAGTRTGLASKEAESENQSAYTGPSGGFSVDTSASLPAPKCEKAVAKPPLCEGQDGGQATLEMPVWRPGQGQCSVLRAV